MTVFASTIYILSCAAWIAAVFLLPRAKEKQNGIVWLAVSLILYECWAAFICGLMSLAHIPVTIVSASIANLLAAGAIFLLYRKLSGEPAENGLRGCVKNSRAIIQKFSFPIADIAFAALLAVFCIYAWREHFGQEAAIIYGTIDPADRFSRAIGILSERTVIGPYPNMYFGHITNALFLGAAEPAFSGVYAIRAFEIKEMVNIWLAGMAFYAALRQLSDKPFARAVFFALGFAYTLGFPWNNALWGFGYLGVSVTLIILVQIGAKMLSDEKQRPYIGLIIIAAGCFGVGITYTVFAPPVFVAAFIAIFLWMRNKHSMAKIALTEIKVFAVPVIMVLIFTVVIGRGEAGSDLGAQFSIEGAIYRNLLGDFLIWLPLALFAVIFAAVKRRWDFSKVFALVFFVFQAYFLYRMLSGSVSTYYYFKFNFVTWFVVLFLAGAAVAWLTRKGSRANMAAIGCWLLVFFGAAVFTVGGFDHAISERNLNMNPIPAANGLFGVYANNNAYFNFVENNPVYYRWDFLELADAAFRQRLALTGDGKPDGFYANHVEIITNSFQDAYWADALVGEHIQQKPVKGIYELPAGDQAIWIVMKHSALYKDNAALIDGYDRVFENGLGFVIVRPEML